MSHPDYTALSADDLRAACLGAIWSCRRLPLRSAALHAAEEKRLDLWHEALRRDPFGEIYQSAHDEVIREVRELAQHNQRLG